MYCNSTTTSLSPAGVQVKAQIRHAGLLSIKAANEWIQDSLKRPDHRLRLTRH